MGSALRFNRIPLIVECRTDCRNKGRSRGAIEREATAIVQGTGDGVGSGRGEKRVDLGNTVKRELIGSVKG